MVGGIWGGGSLAIVELGKKDVGVRARTTRAVGMVEVRSVVVSVT